MLYLSRLTKQKGVDILLDAWDSMNDTERNGHTMVVAGTGPMEQDVIDASNSPSEFFTFLIFEILTYSGESSFSLYIEPIKPIRVE